jgi:hypothetical protein
MRLWTRFAPALTMAALALSTSALAGEPTAEELQRARDLFAESERAERAEKWGEALGLLVQVAAIKVTPGILFHMATCEEQLGRTAAALDHFEQAERLAAEQGVADVKALAASRIPPLRQRVPRVVVAVRPPIDGLQVLLDGDVVPAERLPELRVQPGVDHAIEVRAPGLDPIQKTVRLEEGGSTRIDVELPATSAPFVATKPVASSPAASAPADAPRTGPPMAPLVAAGGAVALGAAGLVTFLVAASESSSGADACARPETCDPSVRDTVRALDRVTLALWIGAGVAAGAAVTLWLLDSPPESGARADGEGRNPTSLHVGASVSAGRVQLVGRF